MPILTNQIGTYTFEDLQGNIVQPDEQIEIFSRPGIDGVGARKTGSRGRPFTVRTVGYVLSWAVSETALSNFRGLVGGNPVAVTQHSNLWGNFLVVNVRQIEAISVENAIGTIVANPKVRQVCEWTLLG